MRAEPEPCHDLGMPAASPATPAAIDLDVLEAKGVAAAALDPDEVRRLIAHIKSLEAEVARLTRELARADKTPADDPRTVTP